MTDRTPLCFCFSGPTASGKSTICRRLLEAVPNLVLSVSSTTRAARRGEADGKDYFFISEEEFRKRVNGGLFVEHATFGGNLYGTEKSNIENAAKSGKDLLLDIEVQGVAAFKQAFPAEVIVTFVFPPSFELLKQRLEGRGAENEQQKALRLKRALEEIEILRSPGFADYFLANGRLDEAVANAAAIIRAERVRSSRLREQNFRIFETAGKAE